MRRGRPLWFLGSVLAGWTGLRVAMLWPAADPIRIVAPSALAAPRHVVGAASDRIVQQLPPVQRFNPAAAEQPGASGEGDDLPAAETATIRTAGAEATPRLASPSPTAVAMPPQSPAAVAVRLQAQAAPSAARPSRLAGDAWLVARPNGGDSLAFGQLGASQAGARLTYALDDDRRLALSARVSAPLRGRGAEAGLGLDVKPTRLPVQLLVEERVPLDGGPARPAAELFGGVSAALPARLRLDAYVQGGAVWKRGGFADGTALAVRSLATRGGVRLEVGAGAWGAAQRGGARLDLGPTLALAIPAGPASVRLAADYRLRAAGHARPGSGPALTLGTSF